MEEKRLSNREIVKILNKDGEIEFCPICDNCTHEVIELVMQNFNTADITYHRLDENEPLFHLTVVVGQEGNYE